MDRVSKKNSIGEPVETDPPNIAKLRSLCNMHRMGMSDEAIANAIGCNANTIPHNIYLALQAILDYEEDRNYENLKKHKSHKAAREARLARAARENKEPRNPAKTALRECIRCHDMFVSNNAGNRLCITCVRKVNNERLGLI